MNSQHDWMVLVGGIIIGLFALPLYISISSFLEAERERRRERRRT